MASSESRASTSEGPAGDDPTGDDAAGGDAARDTYTYGPFFRGAAYALLMAAVLVAAATLWIAVSGEGPSELVSPLGFLVLALTSGYQSAGTLLSTFRLNTNQLRQERPLHADKAVSLGEIRRMFIGGQDVEIYTSPGPEPDLEFERKLRGGDELIEKLAQRLPPGAEIEHPSGELAERLGKIAV